MQYAVLQRIWIHGGEIQVVCDMGLGCYEVSRNHFKLYAVVIACINFYDVVLIHNKKPPVVIVFYVGCSGELS